jgi:UDP-N-acetylglucosamine diphosphorylase/glucosamine-1-phosphate N-acetyltransferase
MNIILFDGPERANLLPLTFTRPVADLRCGILTLREKWERRSGLTTTTLTEEYLSPKWPVVEAEENILINGSICATDELFEAIRSLANHEVLRAKPQTDEEGMLIACKTDLQGMEEGAIEKMKSVYFDAPFVHIQYPWDLFSNNAVELENDFNLLTEGRESAPISGSNTLIGDRIFLEEGASVEASTLNSVTGPIYLGTDATIMEGSMVRGGLALCDHATLKMGAKIYGATTVGPHSKVGGEVNNSILIGYSNKGHDGFLGNSVIGEWCNLGADTNNSNLKNNYAEVKVWNYPAGRFIPTGLQFCGLIMGDHSKSGINTMFNTGTVVGVSANIFGGGFPRNFIPSFSWGGAGGMTDFKLAKAEEVAERVMERRNISFDEKERAILEHLYQEAQEKK